jgi:hypothetical protein
MLESVSYVVRFIAVSLQVPVLPFFAEVADALISGSGPQNQGLKFAGICLYSQSIASGC